MAAELMNKEEALSLVARAIRAAKLKTWVFERAASDKPIQYRGGFLGFFVKAYCDLHGTSYVSNKSAWGESCSACFDARQKANAIREVVCVLEELYDVAGERAVVGNVLFNEEEIRLLRDWAPEN